MNIGDLDKTFHFIMKRMVETGQAPHYTEIAKDLGVSMEWLADPNAPMEQYNEKVF